MGKNNWQGIFGHMVQYLLTLQQYGKMVTTTVMKLPECTTNGSRMICSLNLSSQTRWATHRRQPSLLTASCCATSQVMPMLFKSCDMVSIQLTVSCCATSQVMPMLFKSCDMVSIQFFRGLPGFLFVSLIFQCTACLGSLLLSIRRTCPSHLSLLSFMMRFIFSSYLHMILNCHMAAA